MARHQNVKKANKGKASNSDQPAKPETTTEKNHKLSRLPSTHKIQKRPLLHPPIPSPRTSAATPKIIYISTNTPFISTLKRVRKLLSHVEDRASGAVKLTRDGVNTFKVIEKGIQSGGGGKDRPRDEEVQIRATGRAIAKAMQIALRLQQEVGWRVRFETGSVGAVDDIVQRDGASGEEKKAVVSASLESELVGGEDDTISVDGYGREDVDVDMDGVETDEAKKEASEEEEIEESRIRRVSCLIIYVGLR